MSFNVGERDGIESDQEATLKYERNYKMLGDTGRIAWFSLVQLTTDHNNG